MSNKDQFLAKARNLASRFGIEDQVGKEAIKKSKKRKNENSNPKK